MFITLSHERKRISDRDFKETAVKLSQQRADIGALAIELGISKNCYTVGVVNIERRAKKASLEEVIQQ